MAINELVIPLEQPQTFSQGFAFAELHMPAVRRELGELPMKLFMDIEKAEAKQDMEEATDLILSVSGGDIAVRIRRKKFWERGVIYGLDFSVRAVCRGHLTEIDKLIDGFGDWYFYGYSSDDKGEIAEWWLLDLDKVRESGVLEDEQFPINPNGDGTAGKYIPLDVLEDLGCVIAHKRKD